MRFGASIALFAFHSGIVTVAPAQGQRATPVLSVRGAVTDTAGAPLRGVEVRVARSVIRAVSDDSGRFALVLDETPIVVS